MRLCSTIANTEVERPLFYAFDMIAKDSTKEAIIILKMKCREFEKRLFHTQLIER